MPCDRRGRARRPGRFHPEAAGPHHLVVLLHGWVKVVAQSHAGYRALLALRGPGELGQGVLAP